MHRFTQKTYSLIGKELRESGIELIGKIPWGTHLCQFYNTREDLLEILVPYFTAGLKNNEYCMWVTSNPLSVAEVYRLFKESMPDLDLYLQRKQLEIIPYHEWYLNTPVEYLNTIPGCPIDNDSFDGDRVLNGWIDRLNSCLKNNFAGLRLTGNTFWLEKEDWSSFSKYEESINNTISRLKILALCTYSLDKCDPEKIISVVGNHQTYLIKKQGEWTVTQNSRITLTENALFESEQRYFNLFNSMTEGFSVCQLIYDNEQKTPTDLLCLDINPAFEVQTGIKSADIVGKTILDLFPDVGQGWFYLCEQVVKSKESTRVEKWFPPLQKWFEILIYPTDTVKKTLAIFCKDITTRKLMEESWQRNQDKYELIFKRMSLGFAYCQVIFNSEGKAEDFIYLEVNEEFEKLTGLKKEIVLNKRVTEVLPIISNEFFNWIEEYGKVANEGTSFSTEQYLTMLDRWLLLTVYSPQKGYFAVLFNDITQRKKMENELKASNKELEQFAYVASHDLQEPLRMISSFTGLLSLRFRPLFNEEAHEFMDYIIDGANRMQQLIQDLLVFSSLGKQSSTISKIDCNLVLDKVLSNMSLSIVESKALITYDPLPSLYVNETSMIQIFQNLISNAIKFRKKDSTLGPNPPKVHIHAKRVKAPGHALTLWQFSIADNGIGIDPKYFERIFQIFHRLHCRDKYPGNGIGLALCKKIIENFGGNIWVNSCPGEGTTFYFTIPQ